jgi:hypothetical protein
MSFIKPLNRTFALAIILLGLFTYNFINAQWVSPGNTPPTGNIAAPLNTNATSQIKTGALGTGPLSVTGNALLTSGAPTLALDDTDGRSFWLHNNSGFLYVLADRDGDKSTFEAPYPLTLVTDNNSANDYALFSSKVLASEYCDRNGGNCSTAAQVRSASSPAVRSFSTYSTTANPQGITRPGQPVCSCAAGESLTGCSGPQSSGYDTAAIIGQNACYGEANTPICTCLRSTTN